MKTTSVPRFLALVEALDDPYSARVRCDQCKHWERGEPMGYCQHPKFPMYGFSDHGHAYIVTTTPPEFGCALFASQNEKAPPAGQD